MSAEFLSCDWGTSSFRLRLVQNDVITAGVAAPHGARTLFDSLTPAQDRFEAFAGFLASQLDILSTKQRIPNRPPLVLSGMASSSIGWKELPYSIAPIRLDGRGLRVEKIEW